MPTAGPSRLDLTPSSALPLAYFAAAHAALAVAFGILAARPEIPGTFYYHPRMAALVHLVTIGWITGSILGAFYIVAPLALRVPMRVGRLDWAAFVAFLVGAAGMVWHVWSADYRLMVPDAVLVTGTVTWVGLKARRGLMAAPVPGPIRLHVVLAFANFLAAAGLGLAVGLDRGYGWFGLQPVAVAQAHLHLAAVGWAAMMVVGLGYRLIPMILPARMPEGRALAVSAYLLEAGLALLVAGLLTGAPVLVAGAACIVAGLGSFAYRVRGVLAHRLPRPPALPRRDWSTWQAHAALFWLLAAALGGFSLTMVGVGESGVRLAWLYGTAGLVGFLSQIVVGMQGRLVPLYAWYRAMAAGGGKPPPQSANELPHPVYARALFLLWAAGVPLLGMGLAFGVFPAIRLGAALLLGGVATGGLYLRHLTHRAKTGVEPPAG